MEKLDKNYCIRVDTQTSEMIEKLACYYGRKSADLLRLVLVPALRSLWVDMERQEHQENQQAPTLARFTK